MDANRVALRLLGGKPDRRPEPTGLTPAEAVVYERLRTTRTVVQLASALAGCRFHGLTAHEVAVLRKATGPGAVVDRGTDVAA